MLCPARTGSSSSSFSGSSGSINFLLVAAAAVLGLLLLRRRRRRHRLRRCRRRLSTAPNQGTRTSRPRRLGLVRVLRLSLLHFLRQKRRQRRRRRWNRGQQIVAVRRRVVSGVPPRLATRRYDTMRWLRRRPPHCFAFAAAGAARTPIARSTALPPPKEACRVSAFVSLASPSLPLLLSCSRVPPPEHVRRSRAGTARSGSTRSQRFRSCCG
jgi:MYXO-CTERM domain-containing protein